MKRLLKILMFLFCSTLTSVAFTQPNYQRAFKDSVLSASSNVDTLTSKPDSVSQRTAQAIIPNKYPLFIPDEGNSFKISYNKVRMNDYRHSAQVLSLLPFTYFQDMGSFGQPGIMKVYGLSNSSVAYSINGIDQNNRWKNHLNTYYLSPEIFDTLEFVSLPSGFLYSRMNNPVHINVNSRNKFAKRSYSRLRFHQAPNEEGNIDLIFNAPLFSNSWIYIQVANSAAEPRGGQQTGGDYNTDFSLWNIQTSLNYLFDNSWVLEASYNHIKENIELNGGVERNSSMYEARNATVIYNALKQKTTAHNFSLNLNADIFKGARSFISTYYRFNEQEYRQNTDEGLLSESIPVIKNDNKYKSYGISGRQIFDYGFFNFDLLGNYERTDYNADLISNNTNEDVFSVGARLSLNLFEAIYPSFYAKTSNIRKVQYTGIGGEAKLKLTDSFLLSGELSFFESPFSLLEEQLMSAGTNVSKQKNTTLELNAELNSNELSARLGYFYYRNDNAALPVIDNYADTLTINEVGYFIPSELERSGINLSLSLNLWKILVTTNSAYYFDNSTNKNNSLPDFTSSSGVYYVDTLFQSNLYLKAGINFKLSGEKSFVTFDNEKSLPVAYSSNGISNNPALISTESVPLAKQFDLFLAGIIQEKATVYFVFENLLDEQYYLLPYYPMYPQGLRFGISWEFLD